MATRTSVPVVALEPMAQPGAACLTATVPPSIAVAFDRVYSIRLAQSPGTPCAQCRMPTGEGPVGYCSEDPLCDLCLLTGSGDLGMVLTLVAVVRQLAGHLAAGAEDRREALEELGAFARLYDRFAARRGPARIIRID